ncbi:MAG: AsnC family transcriptional regulator [Nitrospirota bacterium]
MDIIDKKILNLIQTGFPIESRPYKIIGEKVGITEQDAFERINRLKENGTIRRIGATFDSRKLGFSSTLCAAKVTKNKIDNFIKVVNSYHGITHNYERDHKYNIWFTLIVSSKEEIESIIKEITEKTGVKNIRNMPAIRFFKVKVDLKV